MRRIWKLGVVGNLAVGNNHKNGKNAPVSATLLVIGAILVPLAAVLSAIVFMTVKTALNSPDVIDKVKELVLVIAIIGTIVSIGIEKLFSQLTREIELRSKGDIDGDQV
jgi:hypothetical protein